MLKQIEQTDQLTDVCLIVLCAHKAEIEGRISPHTFSAII